MNLEDNLDEEPLIPPTPSVFHIEIDKSEEEKKQKKLKKGLLKYGITNDEWEALQRYKGKDYFMLSTMLHEIDLLKLKFPSYGKPYYDIPEPEELIDIYEKMYSAMCKFGMKNEKEMHIVKVDSELFSDEMRKSGQTESWISFSKDKYHHQFLQDKYDILIIDGTLEKGTPCIDYSEFEDDPEREVTLPPFLNIKYDDNEKSIDDFTAYEAYISKNFRGPLTDQERENMNSLKKSIQGSRIPNDYYECWYGAVYASDNKEEELEKYKKLRSEFVEWQDNLKKYLNLSFREIENEIQHPKIKGDDFLQTGMQLSEEKGVGFWATLVERARNVLKNFSNRLK